MKQKRLVVSQQLELALEGASSSEIITALNRLDAFIDRVVAWVEASRITKALLGTGQPAVD